MTIPLGGKIVKGILNVSIRQVAGALIAAAGSILLARYLGLELLGIYAVSSFFLNMVAVFVDFGLHNCVIKRQEEVDEEFSKTAFTIKSILVVIFAVIVLFVLAPVVSAWYGSNDLYWLISLSFIGTAITSLFKMSQSLLEKNMEYGKLGVVEIIGVASFYLPSVILAFIGFGVFAIAAGEIARGLSSLVAFVIRPFKVGILYRRDISHEIFRFGSTYISSVFTWMITSGINPIVVGRVAGLEAAGVIRVAEGIVSQLTFFKGITDRISYPTFGQLQGIKESIVDAIERGRIYQFIFGVLPLFFFAALSFWLVPIIYGDRWFSVANVLPLLCITMGVNTIFGLYSSALITIGKNWEVTKFHVIYAALLWAISPLLVSSFGYLGLPVAGIITTPAYFVIHKYFIVNFGRIKYRGIFILLSVSWLVTIIAWYSKNPLISAAIFLSAHTMILAFHGNLREDLGKIILIVRPKLKQA
jgi:O-antigen/teichoic acid export membrane protein